LPIVTTMETESARTNQGKIPKKEGCFLPTEGEKWAKEGGQKSNGLKSRKLAGSSKRPGTTSTPLRSEKENPILRSTCLSPGKGSASSFGSVGVATTRKKKKKKKKQGP